MRVSFEWLKTLVDTQGKSPEDLAQDLVCTGTEVEGIETLGEALEHVVVGYVEACEPHPDSDHMHVTTVNVGKHNLAKDGEPQPLQIVCGAPNIKAGIKVLVAMVGATLPGDFKIKKAKLRGVESIGMICSARELGVGQDHDGIVVLPDDTPLGMAAAEFLGTGDAILDCEITPNRPDCLNMVGFAREVAATLDSHLYRDKDSMDETSDAVSANGSSDAVSANGSNEQPAQSSDAAQFVDANKNNPSVKHEGAPATDTYASVQLADEGERCLRYVARVLTSCTVKESPAWLQKRIAAAGTRPINNIVDITNYVLYLVGQPLHAFDLDKLKKLTDSDKPCIVVRAARDGEKFTTLDGEERTLTSDNTVICVAATSQDTAPEKTIPVALAGVMGGANSEIDEDTTNVLLESAAFTPSFTSRTSRDLNLISESSLRFERGVDVPGCLHAAEIACALLEAYADAHVAKTPIDCYPNPQEPLIIELSTARTCALAGTDIPTDFMSERLEKLGCKILSQEDDQENRRGLQKAKTTILTVEVPTYRPDLTREIDLIEEIVRLWGMEKIEAHIPAAKDHAGGYTTDQVWQERIKMTLEEVGISETISYTFASQDDVALLGEQNENTVPVRLLVPLSQEEGFLRQSLMPGLLKAVAYNLAHGTANVSLYEQDRVFFAHKGKKQPKEPTYLSAVFCGQRQEDTWDEHLAPLDFYDAKGALEDVFAGLHIKKYRFKPADPDRFNWLFPGRAAEVVVNKRTVGWVGELHPLFLKRFNIEKLVIGFELNQDELLTAATERVKYRDISPYPTIDMDLAIVMDEEKTYAQCVEQIRRNGGKYLKDVRLFDVYQDEKRLGKGKKSMAFSLIFSGGDRTLTQDEVDKSMAVLVEKIKQSLNAEVRA